MVRIRRVKGVKTPGQKKAGQGQDTGKGPVSQKSPYIGHNSSLVFHFSFLLLNHKGMGTGIFRLPGGLRLNRYQIGSGRLF
jgi:hypothetical protein